MLKKYFAALVIAGLICSAAFAADDFQFEKEKVGNLHIGLSEKEVRKIVSGKPIRGPEKWWGADGQYHQKWKYPEVGITLSMVSEKKSGIKSIESITITSPSMLRTQRGIGIGSTEQEVMEAYGRFQNAEDSKQGELLVAGSIFGGVMFNLHKGRVARIFIGAAAE